jgi:murein DD-endopeptidase MepM/ murein hydrolase activator NlpD
MGVDYPTPIGSLVAVARGTVMMAEEMFFEGNAVLVDHGDGRLRLSRGCFLYWKT